MHSVYSVPKHLCANVWNADGAEYRSNMANVALRYDNGVQISSCGGKCVILQRICAVRVGAEYEVLGVAQRFEYVLKQYCPDE